MTIAIKKLIDQDSSNKILEIPVKDILRPVFWLGSNACLQEAMEMMQNNAVSHIMIGTDGNIEGIVSNSDINSGLSPYLKPVFSKWRRPQDTATLKIQLKWLMSQPVYSLNDQATVRDAVKLMADNKIGFAPVKDSSGKVLGSVSVYDLFVLLLS